MVNTNTRIATIILVIVVFLIVVVLLGGVFLPPHTDFGPGVLASPS